MPTHFQRTEAVAQAGDVDNASITTMNPKLILLALLAVALFGGGGCTLVSENHVFPKPEWYCSLITYMQRLYMFRINQILM